MAGTRSTRHSFLPWFAWAIGVGVWLRVDQLPSQLLLEDEWHAVYRVVHESAAQIFHDFGHSDSSIPLTLLYALEARTIGVSEIGMRLPLVAAGIVTLILFPWYVARRIGRAEALVFAALLAISPLLYFFSRTARPYALTLLLAWLALVAFRRSFEAQQPRIGDTLAYAAFSTLAAWLHPVIGPFVVAPFLPAAWRCMRAHGDERRQSAGRLALLAIAAAVPMAVLLLPPLIAHPDSLRLKSGADLPGFDTLIGAWYLWLGSGATAAVLLATGFGLPGMPVVWRRVPEAPAALAGIALTLLAILLTRPAWIHNPLTFARYLLPALPLLLLATACGAVSAARVVRDRLAAGGASAIASNALATATAALPLLALAATTPLRPVLASPNASSTHAVYAFDFRAERNPVARIMDGIPLSPWWASLGNRPPGSLAIAVAPFPTDSAGWDAPRWQLLSRQRILHGFLVPLCADPRPTEVPADERFRFRNAVHVGDRVELASHHVDFVAWQKPYHYDAHGLSADVAGDVAHCGPVLRAHFGAPAYEDEWLAVYRVDGGGERDAPR